VQYGLVSFGKINNDGYAPENPLFESTFI